MAARTTRMAAATMPGMTAAIGAVHLAATKWYAERLRGQRAIKP